ncbi:carnitine O-acetyltransferase yat1 [Microbotryomycetes sp. JL221]|nr:carnitine O-acetyltransferase yat1 [Microbotryomycetes sp. JL221]
MLARRHASTSSSSASSANLRSSLASLFGQRFTQRMQPNAVKSRSVVTSTLPGQASPVDWTSVATRVGIAAVAAIGLHMGLNRETRDSLSPYEASYLNDTFKWTGGGLLITALTAKGLHSSGVATRIMSSNPWLVMGAGLVAGIGSMLMVYNTQPGPAHTAAWALFSAVQGATLSPMFFLNPAVLSRAGLYTLGAVGGLSYVGATAKNEQFLWLGGPLMAGLGVLICASLAPMLMPRMSLRTLSTIENVTAYGGVALFSGMILFDVQRVLKTAELAQRGLVTRDPVRQSVSLILDVINLFTRIVQSFRPRPRKLRALSRMPSQEAPVQLEAKPGKVVDGPHVDGPVSVPGRTLAFQDKLPKLPIPPLNDTLQRYLRALEGLQSPHEHARTKRVVQDFLDNEGPELHQALVDYASTRASFIEEFWTESYLSHSESVVLSLNPFFILEDDPTPARGNQLMRATSLILASLGFVHDFRTGQLEPDSFRGTPLDMSQYSKLFGTSRIPTKTGCKMQVDPESKHIVVMARGQFYWFDVLDSKNRPLLTERALLQNLAAILADAGRTPVNQVAQSALGVLSTERRAIWAGHRETLMRDPGNAMCLDVLDKALFVVCLDDTTPESASEMCSNMLCGTYKLEKGVQVGTCTNRYYDKLQIIVAANGSAGVNFEHSGVDGHTVLRFVADVYTELILRFAKSINSASTTLFKAKTSPWAKGAGKRAGNDENAEEPEDVDTESHQDPKKLEWVMTPELKVAVRFAETRLSDLICSNEAMALEFDAYGKNAITQHGFSPDAFVQMAYQAAYFSLYGRVESTYEPAMTKAFLHGRTEAIRTVTPECLRFVKTFCSDASPRDKINALRTACKAHTELTKNCSKGLGQDRVMYAMYCLNQQRQHEAKERARKANGASSSDSDSDDTDLGPVGSTPALFTDAGYATLNESTLSTSNCGNPALRLFGFGPTAASGFGIGYIIKDDSIAFCASSRHRQTSRFLDALRAYFLEVYKMMKQLHSEANRRPNASFVDHYAGEIDAKTGRPLAGYRVRAGSAATNNGASRAPNGSSQSLAGEPGDDEFAAYSFYGELSEDVERALNQQRRAGAARARIAPGTRIESVEL